MAAFVPSDDQSVHSYSTGTRPLWSCNMKAVVGGAIQRIGNVAATLSTTNRTINIAVTLRVRATIPGFSRRRLTL
jgi:hypothetical protein